MRGKNIGKSKPATEKKKKPRVTGVRKEQDIQKHKITDYLIDLLGYKNGMKLPTVTYRKIESYRETCGFEVLYNTIVKQKDSILWAINNKEFKNETAKICYIFAIIQNNVGEVYLEQKKANKTSVLSEDVIPADLDIHNDFVRKARDLSAYVEDYD